MEAAVPDAVAATGGLAAGAAFDAPVVVGAEAGIPSAADTLEAADAAGRAPAAAAAATADADAAAADAGVDAASAAGGGRPPRSKIST